MPQVLHSLPYSTAFDSQKGMLAKMVAVLPLRPHVGVNYLAGRAFSGHNRKSEYSRLGSVSGGPAPVSETPGFRWVSQTIPSKSKHIQAKKLGSSWFYSSESGLFNSSRRASGKRFFESGEQDNV
jgi:hypothetical protein